MINESISVAEIIALEDLNVIDFSFVYERNDEKTFLRNLIALLFIASPTEEKKEAYLYTQIMCSYIKKLGYDGICYTSCQNRFKLNYVFFNYSKCKAISSDVYSVGSIKYEVRKKFQADNNV